MRQTHKMIIIMIEIPTCTSSIQQQLQHVASPFHVGKKTLAGTFSTRYGPRSVCPIRSPVFSRIYNLTLIFPHPNVYAEEITQTPGSPYDALRMWPWTPDTSGYNGHFLHRLSAKKPVCHLASSTKTTARCKALICFFFSPLCGHQRVNKNMNIGFFLRLCHQRVNWVGPDSQGSQ